MVGFWAILVQQMQDFQESSWVCERWCHRSFCHQNIIRITSDRNRSAKHRYGQSSWSKNGAELSIILLWILPCCLLFWGHISSFNETCLFFVSLLFWKHEMFSLKVILTKYFDQALHAIKINQSWRLKVFWLQKWLDAWKWNEVTKQFWTHTSWNSTTPCS